MKKRFLGKVDRGKEETLAQRQQMLSLWERQGAMFENKKESEGLGKRKSHGGEDLSQGGRWAQRSVVEGEGGPYSSRKTLPYFKSEKGGIGKGND